MSDTDKKKPSLLDGSLISVLGRATHDDLALIVEALDRSFDVIIKQDERYKRSTDDLTAIPDVIANHLTRAGGNAFANIWRGNNGPPYAEVLHDVCMVMKVKVPKDMGIVEMEEKLLSGVMERVWAKMTPEQREEVTCKAEETLDKTNLEFRRASASYSNWQAFSFLGKQGSIGLLKGLIGEMSTHMVRAMLLTALRQAGFSTSRMALGAITSVANPVFLVVGAAWTGADLVGPSYRGLTPAIFHVASLRQKFLWLEEEEPEAA